MEVSARHVHLNKEASDILFGKDYAFSISKNLSQKGQYAYKEKVELVGPKGGFKSISILGPERKHVQVEISKTDARKIGINAPIRESGDIKNSGGCKLVGPCGEIDLKEGVIVAKRHIHASLKDAHELNVRDRDVVCVAINSKERSTIFKDVIVRVSDEYSLAMHIDTDEANACNFSGEDGEMLFY